MIYEIRTYEAVEGRAEALRSRFETEVIPRLRKYGIELLGVFRTPDETGRLTYLTRFEDEAAYKQAWASFGADPEWRAIKAKSEENGPLMRSQTATRLEPTVAGLLLD